MLALAAVTLLALVFRLGVLAAQGTSWFDEAFSLHFAQLPWSEMLRLLAYDVHPPLFGVVLKLWVGIGGGGITVARWFSVLCGTALVPVVYLLGKEIAGERRRLSVVGLLAASLVALSPLLAFHSAEARMYPLLTLLVAGAMLAWWHTAQDGESRRRWEVGWAALCGLALLAQVMAAIPVAIMTVAGAWQRRVDRPRLRRWMGVAFVASLPFAAWLGLALWHRLPTLMGEWQFVEARGGWGPGVLADFFFYGTTGFTRMWVAGAAWVLLVIGAWCRTENSQDKEVIVVPMLGGVSWRRIVLCVLAAAPIVLLAAMPRSAIKYAFVGLPAVAVLVALGVVALARRVPAGRARHAAVALAVSGTMALLASPMLAQLHGPRFRWDQVGEYIETRERPSDLVYASWFVMELTLREHYDGALPIASAYPYDPSLTFDERVVRYAGNISYPPSVFADLQAHVADRSRVFVVAGGDALGASPIVEWLLMHGWRVEERMSADRFTPGVIVLRR
jgi:4-amino-4-deoxy-L-arabinose transferase-like glycosyltransferase